MRPCWWPAGHQHGIKWQAEKTAGKEIKPRLQSLGRSVGRYLGQIAAFVSFSTETPPFPFTDWPPANL